jgi:DNA invertase Pin-like site-specific DNA recombinase
MGHAGIVLGLEVSRLARNCTDWHRLLELCSLNNTLSLDEDGLYDSTQVNDRLLFGLKGTLSEAELHLLRARMRGGSLAKTRRGELRIGLPVGFVYDELNRAQRGRIHHRRRRSLRHRGRPLTPAAPAAEKLSEQHLRSKGKLTCAEMAARLGCRGKFHSMPPLSLTFSQSAPIFSHQRLVGKG